MEVEMERFGLSVLAVLAFAYMNSTFLSTLFFFTFCPHDGSRFSAVAFANMSPAHDFT